MVDTSDAAHAFVVAANRKEAAQAIKRATPKEPSPALNIAVMGILLWVASTHLMNDDLFYVAFFTALAAFIGYTAWRALRQRKGAV